MLQRDLLQLADLALKGHVSPDLPQEVIRILTEATGADSGTLLNGDRRSEARWPGEADEPLDTRGVEWQEVALGRDAPGWTALLRSPTSADENLFVAARLALHVWDLREELKRSRFDERFRLWELEAVRAIAQDIGGVLEPGRIVHEVLAHVVSLLGVRNAEVLLGKNPEAASSIGVFGSRIFDHPVSVEIWEDGLKSPDVIAAPLPGRRSSMGLLAVANKEARAGIEAFEENDLRVVELFAVQTAVALENARLSRASIERARLRQEMELAATIQSHLYPKKVIEMPGLHVGARFQPAQQVGGDLFEVILRGDQLLATVADVTGKGVGAGLIAAGIHAGLRLMAEEDLAIEEIAARLNGYLGAATEDNRFATMAMIQVAPDGRFTAMHAGHCPSLLRRSDGEVETIGSLGLPLGILPNAEYRPVEGRLNPGDVIAIYTDGLTEAENPDGEELGVDRLLAYLADIDDGEVEAICDAVLAKVAAFCRDAPLADDATIVVLRKT